MLWILDGYNVIRSNPGLLAAERQELQSGREALLLLAEVLLADRPRDRVLVVFDGPARATGPDDGSLFGGKAGGRVSVRFSAGRTADDLILERLETETNPRQVTVVSRDREITRAARRRRCRVFEPEVFLCRVRDGEQRRRASAADRVSPEARGKIETELRRRWLPEKKND